MLFTEMIHELLFIFIFHRLNEDQNSLRHLGQPICSYSRYYVQHFKKDVVEKLKYMFFMNTLYMYV